MCGHTQQCPTPKNGFTLLEVLVALVILGLSLAFLTGTIFNSLLLTDRIDREDRAITFADGILARLGSTIPLHPAIVAGADDNLRWTLSISPISGVSKIDQIDLVIYSSAGYPIGKWQTLRIVQPTNP